MTPRLMYVVIALALVASAVGGYAYAGAYGTVQPAHMKECPYDISTRAPEHLNAYWVDMANNCVVNVTAGGNVVDLGL